MIRITIDAVDKRSRWIAATVITDDDVKHRVGHIPAEKGWFCCCGAGRRCKQIKKIKDLVPPMGEVDA